MIRRRNILVGILAIVTVLATMAFVKGCMTPASSMMTSATHGNALYQCAMHPTIVSSKPDNCPICGMRLERVEQAPEAGSQKTVTGMGRSMANGSKGKLLYYRHPMRPDITSPKPAKDEMGMDYIPVYEAEESGAGASRIAGHAEVYVAPERQQLIGVQTARVEARPLFLTIRAVGRVAYDPELYNFLSEYKEALAAQQNIQRSPLAEVREQGAALVRAAKLKLQLLGLNEAQIDELMNAGDGTANLLLSTTTAWVYADIYEYEANLVQPGQTATITTPALPRARFEGHVKSVDALLNAMSRTLRARIEVPNSENALKPEMFVDAVIQVPLGTKLAIPEDALIDTGSAQMVFIDKGDGHLEPRAVQVGYEAAGYYEVLSGLSEGEKVVSSANFLIDSESRFRAAAQSFRRPTKDQSSAAAPKTAAPSSTSQPH